jgi:hypothetical protein
MIALAAAQTGRRRTGLDLDYRRLEVDRAEVAAGSLAHMDRLATCFRVLRRAAVHENLRVDDLIELCNRRDAGKA